MTVIVTLTPNPTIDVSTSIDQVVPFRKLRCAAERRDPGGGGINVARVIKRLGGDVVAVYPSGGAVGQVLHRLAEDAGIAGPFLPVAQETRENFTVTESGSGQQFRFVLPGPRLEEAEWRQCLDALAAVATRLRYVVASGSLPPGVPEDFYLQAARIAKDRGAAFVLDTSGAPLRRALDEGVHLIKPNLREFCELFGRPLADRESWIAAARSLIAAGRTEMVALSLGNRGALLVTPDRAWYASALSVPVVSVIGAGDSFLAGMMISLVNGEGLENALRRGVAAGSAALLASGTGLCARADVERLFSGVAIEAA